MNKPEHSIVVLISGSGTNMAALVRACEAGEVPARVTAVVADRDCKGLAAAEEFGIDSVLLSPSQFADRDAWSEVLADEVDRHSPDLVVSAGFMRILGPAFVDRFTGRLINIHPSLLPAFPGAHAVEDALAAGVKVTGTTVHYIDHLVDHGPIVAQAPVEVLPDDTVSRLHERIKEVEHRVLAHACRDLLEGRVQPSSSPVRDR